MGVLNPNCFKGMKSYKKRLGLAHLINLRPPQLLNSKLLNEQNRNNYLYSVNWSSTSVTRKKCQMSIKVAQK